MIELWGGREGIAEVLHGLLAVALQVWHDVSRVVPPQQVQHLHPNTPDIDSGSCFPMNVMCGIPSLEWRV